MRAKMRVHSVAKLTYGTDTISQVELEMYPVCPPKFKDDGTHEDSDFHKWTPSGLLRMSITNPVLFDKFEKDQVYYLDFTLVK